MDRQRPSRRAASRTGAALSMAGLVIAALLGLAAPASAHDELAGSTPASGATLRTPPTAVTLTMSEPPSTTIPPVVVVTGPDGARVEDGKPTVTGSVITQALRPVSEPGAYEIAFRVVADDGHPLTGTIPFSIAATAATQSATAGPTSSPVEPSPAPSESFLAGTGTTTPSPSQGAPSAAPSATTIAVAPSNSSGGGSSPWPWVIGGVVALGLLGGGAYLLRARQAPGAPSGGATGD